MLVLESLEQIISEGTTTYANPKAFWYNGGDLIECPDTHERYATSIGSTSEQLMEDGWVRVGMISSRMWVEWRGPYSERVHWAVASVAKKNPLPKYIDLENRKMFWSGEADDFLSRGIRGVRKSF